jgi:hypothetical protein
VDVLPEAEDFMLDFEDGRAGLASWAVARGVESSNVRMAIEYWVREGRQSI